MLDKKSKIINLILILIIAILIFLIIYLLLRKEENENLKPTGNIDIFEITCDYNCNCNKDEEKQENLNPVFGENWDSGFEITDNNISWQSINNLNIFSNPMYEMDNKIAPESTNFYQFVIKNNTIYDVDYNIVFNEVNKQKINMKYRLIKNDEYIVGNKDKWVTATELSLNNIQLKTTTSDTFYLEWKWFSSDNDTQIGEKANADYSLNINIKAVRL